MYRNISQSLNTFADRTYNFTADLQHLTADIIDNTRHHIASVDVNQILTETDALNNEIPSLLTNITNTAASTMMANISRSSTTSYTDTSPHPDVAQRLEHAPQLTASALVKVYVLMAMAVVSLTGNVATMWNIYKTRIARRSSRHTWSAIYTLIFHLSIADLIVTGFCIVGDAAWYYTVQWLAGEQSCKLVKLFQMFGLYLSTYVLVLIGVDRWIAVKYPMKSLNMAKRCYRLLGGIYVLSLVLSMPQYFIFRVRKGPFIEDFYQCVTHGFYEYDWQEQLYTTFTMVFMFLLPLAILFGTYLSTFRTISDSEQMFQGSKLAIYSNKPSMQTNRQRLIHKAKMKSLRISVVIIFAFLVCWTPYNVMMIIFIFLNPDKSFSEDLQKGIFFFGMANSLVNPLIYGAFHLCPTKRKAAKAGSNNKYSLTRGDSQRSPSMLTAVTLVDCNQRSSRILRQASYLRTYSNGSQKEHIGLLQNPTARNAVRKSASLRSQAAPHKHPHPLWKQQQSLQERATTHWSGSPADSFCVMSSSNGGTIAVPSDRSVIDEQRSAKINSLNGFISSKEQISHV